MSTADTIRHKVQELARDLGRASRPPADDEILPQTGLLDSAAILELVMWIETRFDIEIDQRDLSLENLGSIRRMVAYIESRKT